MTKDSYTVIWRSGGTERFQWNKCTPVPDRKWANLLKHDIERMGYAAIVHRTSQLEKIGLPETWD